jgi:hypothetical protein
VYHDDPGALSLLPDALQGGEAARMATEALPEAASHAFLPVVAALLGAGADSDIADRRPGPGWPMLPDRKPAARAPESVTHDEVRRLTQAGAQLVEVLPRDEFDDEHLPGAISLPLKALTAETSAELDRSLPVIVYCWDGL